VRSTKVGVAAPLWWKMKTEIRVREHTVLPGQQIVELWYDGELIGQVCGADGPGARVLSKYTMTAVHRDPMVIDVTISPGNYSKG
jgi:hypothetical protein